MSEIIFSLYRLLFARQIFYKFNKFLYRCSLSGMGVMNYQSEKISGEHYFLTKLLKHADQPIVFDVGANTGKYSNLLLNINPSCVIYAFEPHPITFDKLSEALADKKAKLINAATSDKEGELTLFDYANQDGSEHASLLRAVIEDIRGAPVTSHQVKTLRLDDFAQLNNIEVIDLLKIDTEGSELITLHGASKLINERRILAIQFEFNEMNVASRAFFKDFWELLADYDLYRLLPDGPVRIHSYSAVYCEIFAFQNIVALLRPNR